MEVEVLSVGLEASIREVMAVIDKGARGIALARDAEGRLAATITDGDIRRAILAGQDLEESLGEALAAGRLGGGSAPITAPLGTSPERILQLMRQYSVRHLPLLDTDRRPAQLALFENVSTEIEPDVDAVVMAGGFGVRLRPLTEKTPKPMLPLGDKPVMEHVVDQLRKAGVQHVSVTTHYLADSIVDYFGDGSRFGLDISYVNEETPLGTAGALGLLAKPDRPVLLVNGDVLTQVDFKVLVNYHVDSQCDMTVGVRRYELRVPYGVMKLDGAKVTGVDEKPSLNFFINAGVYVVAPSVFDLIRPQEHLDATDLIDRLVAAGLKVVSFPIHEYWLDVGQPGDYRRAQGEWAGE